MPLSPAQKSKTVLIIGSLLASILIFFVITGGQHFGALTMLRLGEIYGFTALWLLFFTLLPGPLYRLFPSLPLKGLYLGARSGLGIATFYFALLHGSNNFITVLSGFAGLPYLGGTSKISIIAAALALCILAALAATSFGWAMRALGTYWKKLHKAVYAAGALVIVHVLLIGAHFHTYENIEALLFPLACIMLFCMYAILQKRRYLSSHEKANIVVVNLVVLAVLAAFVYVLFALSGIHHTHVQ